MKAKISKTFTGELARVDIAPTDKLPDPHPEDVPTLDEALKLAATHRPEIEQADLNLRNQEYTIAGYAQRPAAVGAGFCHLQLCGIGRRSAADVCECVRQ